MININLLPKELRRSTGPNYWVVGSATVAGVSVLTMLILQLSAQGTLNGLSRDIAEAQSEIEVRRPDVAERDRLRAEKTQLEAVTSVATTLRNGQTSWSEDLARFVRQIPSASTPTVALSTLTMTAAASGTPTTEATGAYDGKAVTREIQINGRARSSAALVGFVDAFEQAQDFGILFPNIARDAQSGDYTFTTTVGMIGSQPPAATPPEGAPDSAPSAQPGASGGTQGEGAASANAGGAR